MKLFGALEQLPMIRVHFLMRLIVIMLLIETMPPRMATIVAWIHHSTKHGNISTIINWAQSKIICFYCSSYHGMLGL